jgi:hypothetical protein
VFGRDMIFPIKHIAAWQFIKNWKQKLIDKNNERENAKRVDYDYQVGDQVLIYTPDPNKMEQPREGPYPVMQVHTNGTVTLQKGTVTQRYNICQIVPFQEWPLIREESALRVVLRIIADGRTGLQPVRPFNLNGTRLVLWHVARVASQA